jgi:hypothetical protein
MNAAIVDTDLVLPYIKGRLLGISFMTLAELERWSLER